MKKVVITGIGALTPIGLNAGDFAHGLRDGRLGAGDITKFDTKNFPVKKAFELKGWTPPEDSSEFDPFIQYAVAASNEALRDARIDLESIDRHRVGVVVSSSKGGVTTLDSVLSRGYSYLPDKKDALLNSLTPDRAAQVICRLHGIKGPVKNYVMACATGTTSIIEGVKMVASGEVDYCLAGATDASITPLILAGYNKMGVCSPDRMRPFDNGRSGFIVGEGAGCVFLESKESAVSRSAKIYGEVLATTAAQDTFHPVRFSPEEGTLSNMLIDLCHKSQVASREIDYLNVHGTATREGDLYETREIKRAFGKDAYDLTCSSTKSMVGHMLGAAGAVEFIACLIAIKKSFVPPTVSYEKPDPECDLNYTPNTAREKNVHIACSISMAFGGHVAGIMVSKATT